MINDGKTLFLCLFVVCLSSWVKGPLKYFVHYKIGLFVFLLVDFESCLFIWIQVLCWTGDLQVFSPSLWLVLLLNNDFCTTEAFYFDEVKYIHFCFYDYALGVTC